MTTRLTLTWEIMRHNERTCMFPSVDCTPTQDSSVRSITEST